MTASTPGVAALDRVSGKGLRWLTPGAPSVSGTAAVAAAQGLSWAYVPTGNGLRFAAIVTQAQGARSYSFGYQLLGGAADLSVDAAGDLVSDAFTISRASIVDASGHALVAGPWQLLPGPRVGFSVPNDASFSLPYVIDPAQFFGPDANLGASFAVNGPGYEPAGPSGYVTTYGGTPWVAAVDDNNGSGSYGVADDAITWDTSAINPTAVPTQIVLGIGTCLQANGDGSSWQVWGDWVSGQPLSGSLYPTTSTNSTNALNGLGVSYFQNPSDPSGCLAGTDWGTMQYPLLTPTRGGFNPGGTTALRLRIANQAQWPSSYPPSHSNYVSWGGYGTINQPQLNVTYVIPPAAPIKSSPLDGATPHSLTLSVQGVPVDPDGDTPVNTAFIVASSPSFNSIVWNPGWLPNTTSVTIPAGVLNWNQTYYWATGAWDGTQLDASVGAGSWSSWTAFTPTNHAPPTPSPMSPPTPPLTGVPTQTPTLVAGAVTDPDNDPVSYQFQIVGSSPSPWLSSPSWVVTPALADNTTYSWQVRAEDNFGFTSGWSAPLSFIVDTTAPVTPTVSSSDHPDQTAWYSNRTVSLAWSDSDVSGIVGYAYSTALDQNPTTTPSPTSQGTGTSTTLTAPGDGVWFFHVRAENGAGLWGPAASFRIQIAGSNTASCPVAGNVACSAWSDQTGLENFYPYAPFSLGTGSAFVNMATGNLVAQYADVNVPGQGLNMRLTRTYNATVTSTTTDGPLGKGWTLGVQTGSDAVGRAVASLSGLDLTATVTSLGTTDEFQFTDDDGTTHHFVKVNGAWVSPPGVNLVLNQDNSIPAIYTLTRPDGVHYVFQMTGIGTYRLTQIADRTNANWLCFSYTSTPGCSSTSLVTNLLNLVLQNLLSPLSLLNPQLNSIIDERGRSITFSWSGTHLTEADFQAQAGGPVLRTLYNVDAGGRLTSVTEAAGTSSQRTSLYGYPAGGSGLLSSVTDTLGNATTFAYNGGQQITTLTDRAHQPWTFAYAGSNCQAPVAGNPICLTDPSGNTSIWTTNSSFNLVDKRDAGDVNSSGGQRYNAATYGWGPIINPLTGNRLVTATDEAANTTSYGYNALGQITQTVFSGVGDPSVTTNFTYQAAVTQGVSDLVKVDTAPGSPQERTWNFSVNPDGSLASQTDPGQNVTRFAYYGPGLLKSITDANGVTTTYGSALAPTFGYDVSGQPTTITDGNGVTQTFTYDFLGDQVSVKDRTAQTWTQSFDSYGHVTQSVTPLGESTLSCYDTNGDLTLVVSPRSPAPSCSLNGTDGYSTKTTYDPRGLVSSTVSTSDGQMAKTTYDYYPSGLRKDVIEPRSFDASGNLLTDPTKIQEVSATYYPDGRLQASFDETKAETDYVYTPNGLPVTVTAPAHDASGTRTTTTNAYNGFGEVKTSQVSGVASPIVNGYDIYGEVTSTVTPNGNTTSFSYWPTGLPHVTTNPNGTTTTDLYDGVGNLVTLSQPTGSGQSTTVTYTYTALNQVRTSSDPADARHSVAYGYDAEGRQTGRYDLYNGVTETTQASQYDADGRLVTATATSTTGAPTDQALYGYDPASNVTSVSTTLGGTALSLISATYSPADQVKTLSETLYTPTGTAVAKSSSYGYLNDGSLSTRTVDGNTTSYGYLLNGAEQTTSPWTGGSFTSTHFPSGDLASQALPNGANVTQTYDTANRLASRAITNPVGATLSSWLMPAGSYDNDGNIVSQTVTQVGVNNNTGSPVTGVARLAYDKLDRLTSFTSAFGSSSTSYTLDDAGNVTFDGAANYAYSANRLQSRTPVNSQGNQPPPTTYGYDHVGNQTTETNGTSVTTTTYDAAFHPLRMSSLDGTWVQYAYDGLGRMARRQDSTGAVTLFFHDGFADQIAEETDASGTGSVTRYLLDSSGAPLGTQAAGQVSFYVSDPRGNLTQTLNATAAVVAVFAYDPFGNALSPTAVSGTATSRLRFQMGPQDPKTGEYNLGPRLYNPQVNRFVGADLPAASAAGLATQVDPLTGNAYLYAGANSAGLIDDGYGPHIGHWLSSAAHFVRKALNNPVVKGVAIGVTIAATVVQDAGVCVVTVGGGCPEVVAASVEEDAAAIGGIEALAEAGGELAAGAETTSEAAANIAPAAPEAAGTSEVALGAEEAPNADATAAGSSEAAGNADAGASGSAAEGGRGNIVYRGLAEGQNPAEGLSARAPDATDVSPIQHVAGKAESPWISTTKDVGVATSKYGKFGVVGIDLSKVGTEVVDISGGFPDAPGMLSNWARADQEVLIRGYIPPEAIIWSNLP